MGWGDALSGLGAGLSGQGPQWQLAHAAKQKSLAELDEKRQAAMAKDFRTARMLLENKDIGGFQSLMNSRLEILDQIGGDPTHTATLMRMVQEGNTDDALGRLKQMEQVAVAEGLLPDMTPEYSNFEPTADGGMSAFNPQTRMFERVGMQEGVQLAPNASGQGGGRTLGKSELFKDSTGQLFFGSNTVDKITGKQAVQLTAVGGDQSVEPVGSVTMVDPYGNNAQERIGQKGAEAQAARTGQLVADLQLAPEVEAAVTKAVENVKTEVKVAGKARDNVAVVQAYETAMRNLSTALGGTSTGPIVGLIPAISASAQSAEAAAKILGVAIKGLVRGAGEGTWTDSDQKQVNDMLPKRTDLPEARAAKIMFIDSFVRAKFGIPQGGIQQEQSVQQAPVSPDIPTDTPPASPAGAVKFIGFKDANR